MRKFQYVVTLDLDDEHLNLMVKEDPTLLEGGPLEGVEADGFIPAFAESVTPSITEELQKHLGDAGSSTIRATFAGEVK